MTLPALPDPGLERAIDDLARDFTGVFARETIARYVLDSQSQLLETLCANLR